jgi:hypothetical protein
MPEYFDISLIGRKTNTSKSKIDACLIQLDLVEGENNSDFFKGKQIIVSYFDDDESDFDEVCIGVPEQYFTKGDFSKELEPVTNFINRCFQCNPNLEYALCSYELNGYLIGQVKTLKDFSSDEFLKRFPIIYRRTSPLCFPNLETNLDAQEIFI